MTTIRNAPWHLEAPPPRREWLPPANRPRKPAETRSGHQTAVSRRAGGSWPILRGANRPLEPGEIRNADVVQLPRRAHEDPFVEVVEPFAAIYGGELVHFERGERIVVSHPAVQTMPRAHFRVSEVRQTDVGRGVVMKGPKPQIVSGTVR